MSEPKLTKNERLAVLSRTFTPAMPVQDKDSFAGRLDQIMQVLSAVGQPGMQVVIYGERGVGKSSLANVLGQLAALRGEEVIHPVRINCSTSDTFAGLWKRVFRAAKMEMPDTWTYQAPEPDEIRTLLAESDIPYVIFDEFDRWNDDEGLTAMADTIKTLSDNALKTKVVIVGVADSIDELIGEHESVKRAIEEVLLPRMSHEDLSAIPREGMNRVAIEVPEHIVASIASLSEGLPSFAHLLSLNAGKLCVADDRDALTADDVLRAVQESVKRHSLLSTYKKAVMAQRKDTLHSKVLLACALAPKDGLGFFTAADVRDPMSEIMGRQYGIPAFSPHLNAFTTESRGAILRREGQGRRYRWRFRDPLLQPFVVLTALSEGWLPTMYRTRFMPTA